jgi:hypothetical protein
VDISTAQLSNAAGAPATVQAFAVGQRVTVVGSLDPSNPLLIHAYTLRISGLISVTPPVGTTSTPPGGQLILPENLFRLSAEEREVFTPPSGYINPSPFHGYTGPSLRSAWEAFNTGSFPATIDPLGGPQNWYSPTGIASQNQGMLWQGMSSLSWALRGNAAQFELAAGKSLQLLALDKLQGHQRHEALGYGNYWAGPVAAMAMAGLYAPAGSTSGPQLLAAAREWWADHITVLRSIRMPDGQVGIIGSRQNSPFDSSEGDLWLASEAAIVMQLADPLPYSSLHPSIKSLISESGSPKNANYPGMTAHWYRPLAVPLWLILRGVQSGALLPVPANHPMPAVDMNAYRWTANGRTYVATPAVCGYSPWRWQVSWAPGEVLRVDAAIDPGSGGKGPNPAPNSVNIPNSATHLFGPAGPATQCDY